jgi:hypothetical protein
MEQRNNQKVINLIEVVYHHTADHYFLRESTINPNHIVSMNPSEEHILLHTQNKLPTGLHDAQEFVKISFSNGKSIVAIGSAQIINEKIRTAKKLLLG